MRRAARTDANHQEIAQCFERAGCSVLHLHALKGAADLLIGFPGGNLLIEVKDGKKPPSKRKLTEKEQKFHDKWLGPLIILETAAQAERVIQDLAGGEGETVH